MTEIQLLCLRFVLFFFSFLKLTIFLIKFKEPLKLFFSNLLNFFSAKFYDFISICPVHVIFIPHLFLFSGAVKRIILLLLLWLYFLIHYFCCVRKFLSFIDLFGTFIDASYFFTWNQFIWNNLTHFLYLHFLFNFCI